MINVEAAAASNALSARLRRLHHGHSDNGDDDDDDDDDGTATTCIIITRGPQRSDAEGNDSLTATVWKNESRRSSLLHTSAFDAFIMYFVIFVRLFCVVRHCCTCAHSMPLCIICYCFDV